MKPSNRIIADIISETADLMELHGENEFKIRSFRNAAFSIGRYENSISDLTESSLAEIKGIGKSIASKIFSFVNDGIFTDHEFMMAKTPSGVLEMLKIKGLGPKKVSVLWRSLGVESPVELLYACNENRLIAIKGFGIKTQEEIRKSIEFLESTRGMFHYYKAEKAATDLIGQLSEFAFVERFAEAGEYRRKCELISVIDFIVQLKEGLLAQDVLTQLTDVVEESVQEQNQSVRFQSAHGPQIVFHFSTAHDYWMRLFELTGSAKHVSDVLALITKDLTSADFNSEHEIYAEAGLQFIEPEMREGFGEIALAKQNNIPVLINSFDLKGCLHNHSIYSDGANSVREMAEQCIREGLQYFGICDHSKTAVYAGGLTEEAIIRQHIEIEKLNSELHPFRIFKGIESDILSDGSLDYSDEILSTFDLVVASIHSGLNMDIDRATERLIKAVENPYTTILGHPTGRLLLSRAGYPVDHRKVIDACCSNGVSLELNAHPYRLDIDWRWIDYAINKGVYISINPDAHHIEGISMMKYGVNVARKAGLSAEKTLNALELHQFEAWLIGRRK